ncbi:insulinase family protein [Pseudoalteromonas rubra]|uniref:insulinase family protein n=1 Tax=Pseudoalteromonas rubra TaxID=43658 RepID=UPI000F78D177|nr:insulinase family protein [Pseudoalteromonas rubra]
MKLSNNDKRNYRHLTLDNGLKILLVEDTSSNKSAASLAINVGHFDDPQSRQGMAHFVEHMLFLGTQSFPVRGEFSQFVSQAGGQSNAWTGTEHSCYFFDCRAPLFEQALERFSEFFYAPLFTEDALQDERNAIDSEFNLKVKDDNRRIIQVHKETVNPAHPFAKFSVGNHNTLADHSGSFKQEIEAFFSAHYQAQWMTLVLAGPHSLDELARLANRYFSAISGSNTPKPPIQVPLYRQQDLGLLLHIEPRKHMQKLIVSFAMPDVERLYKFKSLSFLAHLLGYEGDGSLYAILKKNGWINALSAGGGVDGSNFKDFNISFALTDDGIEYYEDIVEMLFEYISLITEQLASLPALYEDKKRLLELAFENQEQSKLLDWVSALSINMHHYDDDDILYGDYCMTAFNHALHEELMGLLSPHNMRLILIHPDITCENDATRKVAQWYNTPYQVERINAEWLQTLANITTPLPEMRLPAANPYLAFENRLYDIEPGRKTPTLLTDRPGFAFWFKQDTRFRVTKGHFYLEIDSQRSVESHKSMAMTRLFADLFMDSVAEQFYAAELAGLSYHLSSHQGGLTLQTAGLSASQLKLVLQLVEALLKQPISATRFAEYKKQLIRHWKNHNKSKPVSELFSLLGAHLMPWNPTPEQLAKALKNISFNEFCLFREDFFKAIHIKAFMHGNWQLDHALDMQKQLHALFAYSEILDDLKKPLNPITSHQQVHIEKSGAEHAFVEYIQAPTASVEDKVKVMAFNQLVSQDYFESLRTQQQLGYLVGAGYAPFNTRAGIAFYVQSSSYDSETLLQRHHQYMTDLVAQLDSYEATQWAQVKAALHAQIAEKDKNLRLRSQRLWIAIGTDDHTFSMQEKLIEALDALTFDTLKHDIIKLLSKQHARITLRCN